MRKSRVGIEMRRINLSLTAATAQRVQVFANWTVRGNISLAIENLLIEALAVLECEKGVANEKETSQESPASV